MIPLLITGGTAEKRFKKALEAYIIRNTQYAIRKKIVSHITYHISHNPDFTLLDSPTSIGIDEIRGLQKRLSLKPFGKGPKVALINNAQNLTIEAQNAFLKTLEEPPKNSQIILTAPAAESLLPTVVSRCHLVNLPYKPRSSLTRKEISQFERSEIKLRLFLNFLISLINSSLGERFKKIDQLDLTKDRQKAIEWLDTLTLATRGLLLSQLSPKPSSPSFPSQPFNHSTILAILKSLLQTKKYLQANVNTRLALDNFLLDLPYLK